MNVYLVVSEIYTPMSNFLPSILTWISNWCLNLASKIQLLHRASKMMQNNSCLHENIEILAFPVSVNHHHLLMAEVLGIDFIILPPSHCISSSTANLGFLSTDPGSHHWPLTTVPALGWMRPLLRKESLLPPNSALNPAAAWILLMPKSDHTHLCSRPSARLSALLWLTGKCSGQARVVSCLFLPSLRHGFFLLCHMGFSRALWAL